MGDVDFVGQQVLGLRVARSFDPRLIFGAVVAHHHRRRLVEAFDLKARLVPDRQADRARARSSCPAAAANPRRSAISAAAASPSSASNMPHWPVPAPICSCTSSSTCALMRPTTLPPRSASQSCALGMFEPRVLARRDQAVDLVLERRDPGRDRPCRPPRRSRRRPFGPSWSRRGGSLRVRCSWRAGLAAVSAQRQLRLRRLSPATISCQMAHVPAKDYMSQDSDPRAQSHRRGRTPSRAPRASRTMRRC